MICEGHLHVRARGSGFIDCFDEVRVGGGGSGKTEREQEAEDASQGQEVKPGLRNTRRAGRMYLYVCV